MRQWRTWITASILTAGLTLVGCGKQEASDTAAPHASHASADAGQAKATAPSPTPAMKAFKDDGHVKEIHIEGSDMMKYNLDKFSLKPGEMVRLTLKHTGNLPAQSMGHNVVILKTGNDPFDFSTDVNENGGTLANSYVPDKLHDRIVAFTTIVGGGQTTHVEFQAPTTPGEYPFLCSFPGHVGNMNGIAEVK